MTTTAARSSSRASRLAAPAALLACLGGTAPAWSQAQDADDTARWGLGLGVASRQLPYAEAKRKNNALPLIYFENRWARVAGGAAELKLGHYGFTATQDVSFGLRLKYDKDGYEAGDSPRLTGMADRKGGFWGGPAVTWRNPVVQLSTEWVADLSGHSKGHKLLLQAEHRFGWQSLSLTPRVQAQWLDSKYVDYYYGVRAEEALPDRAAYLGRSALAVEAGLRLDYALAPRHAVFLDLSATHLPGEIKASPIVGRSSTSRVAAGYLYRF